MNIKEAVQKEYFKLLEDSCQEIFDDKIRHKFIEHLDILMNNLRYQKQICEFLVVCDESNNCPQDIEDGFINVYVYYKEFPFDFEYKEIVIGNPKLLDVSIHNNILTLCDGRRGTSKR